MCEIWPMPMTLALASNTLHYSTAHTRDTYWEPQCASHGNYRVDPVVDRVERTDRLSCFVDRLDRLHRLVDDFTTRLDLDDFRST